MEGPGALGNSIIILSCNLLYILMRETAGIIFILWVLYEPVKITVWYVPAPATGMVYVGTGAV